MSNNEDQLGSSAERQKFAEVSAFYNEHDSETPVTLSHYLCGTEASHTKCTSCMYVLSVT